MNILTSENIKRLDNEIKHVSSKGEIISFDIVDIIELSGYGEDLSEVVIDVRFNNDKHDMVDSLWVSILANSLEKEEVRYEIEDLLSDLYY